MCADIHFSSRFPLGLSLVVVTLVAYLTFWFEWTKLRLSCHWHTLLSIYMIMVVLPSCILITHITILTLIYCLSLTHFYWYLYLNVHPLDGAFP